MAAITLTGTLTKVEAKQMTDPDYLGMRKYSPNTERYLHFVNCCLTTAEGKRYYFDSPKVSFTVGNCPGAAVCLYHIEGEAVKWFAEVGEGRVATAEKANGNRLEPLVKLGDTLTIRASVKAEKSNYTTVNRVKRLS